MLSRLMCFFVATSLAELAILLKVGQWIGPWPTVALVVATGVGGAALARQQGLRALLAVQREVAACRVPGQSLLDGLSVLVGGALLLTPGILTDAAGFSLLVPASRRWVQRAIMRRLKGRISADGVRYEVFAKGTGHGR